MQILQAMVVAATQVPHHLHSRTGDSAAHCSTEVTPLLPFQASTVSEECGSVSATHLRASREAFWCTNTALRTVGQDRWRHHGDRNGRKKSHI